MLLKMEIFYLNILLGLLATIGLAGASGSDVVLSDLKKKDTTVVKQKLGAESNSVITRAALGSSASLGDLYDARRDELCGISIFKKTPPNSTITAQDDPGTNSYFVYEESYNEKFSKLDITASLQATLLSGKLKLSGSANYISDTKKSSRSVKTSLIYKITTKQETLNIYHEDLRDSFSLDAIANTKATHIVQKIMWGANTILTCQHENKENHDTTKIKGELSVMVNLALATVNGEGSMHGGWGENYTDENINIRLFGDILIPDEGFPTTIEDAANMTKEIPNYISKNNDGKGKQLRYALLPIELVKKHLNVSVIAENKIHKIDDGKLLRVVQFFDRMLKHQQKLEDLYQDAIDFKYCLQDEDFDKIDQYMTEMEIEQAYMRANLSAVLIQVRAGTSNVEELDKLLQTFHSSHFSPQNMRKTFHEWQPINDKLDFAKDLLSKRVTYIGQGSSFQSNVIEICDVKCLVLFFSELDTTHNLVLALNMELFFGEVAKQEDNMLFFVVDYSLQPELAAKYHKAACVKLVMEREIIDDDLIQRRKDAILKDAMMLPVMFRTDGVNLSNNLRIINATTAAPNTTNGN